MVIFNDGIAETRTPVAQDIETDVLIIGSGPFGASIALFLSELGVRNIMVTKYRWTANTPRAHITNQRSMEIFRDLGVVSEVKAQAVPHELIGDTVFCTSIAGDEIGRVPSWGTHPTRHAEYELASPELNCDIPQTLLEPIMVSHATRRGTQMQFSVQYVSHVQDDDGVTTKVLNRVTGTEHTIRSKYLIGADGARSQVAADIELPLEGRMDIAGSMNIIFKADLSQLVGHRPSALYWVLSPGANVGGIGAGLVRMVRPWNEWLIVWGFDIEQGTPEVSEDEARQIVRTLVGVPDLEVVITGISLWGNNEQYATELHRGRVFCGGDAVHKHPPNNGLGSNTSVGDAYNLAWKLSAVLRGQAGPALLETYDEERAPVARQIVTRANQSGRESGKLFEALGITEPGLSEEQMRARVESRKDATAEGRATREAVRQALELKNYEFNAHGVELGQSYDSSAVVGDGTPSPEPTRDPDLHYDPSTRPGVRLPHAWVGDAMTKVSTHDLAPYRRFTLFTGVTGGAWAQAAESAAAALGIDVQAVVIGPGQEVTDLYSDWERLREVDEDGAVLVRPDKHIGWRARSLPDDPAAALREALASILSRPSGGADA